MPVGLHRGAHIAHQTHQPGKSDRQGKQGILSAVRDLAPVRRQGLGVLEHQRVDDDTGDDHHQRRRHLSHRGTHLVDGVGEVAIVDAEKDDISYRHHIDRHHQRIADRRPGHRRHLVGAAIELEREKGDDQHQVHRDILRRHDPQRTEEMVVAATQLGDLRRRQDQRMRRHPGEETDHQHKRDKADQRFVTLRSLGARHACPEVVVTRQQDGADQHRLHNKQPGQDAAHGSDAHLLGVGVDLRHQPVAGEGQRQKGKDGDKVGGVAHPVVVSAFLWVLGAEELISRIGPNHRATEADIGDKAMQVDRVPQRPLHHLPDIADHRADLVDAGGGHHEGGPGVGHHHDGHARAVQQQTQRQMHPLGVAVTHRVPAIIIGVEEETLEKKQSSIDQPLGAEHMHHIAHKVGIEQKQRQGQGTAENSSNREAGEADLHELMGHAVVAFITAGHANQLDHQYKQRHRQHQRAKEQVHLRQNPHHRAAADPDVGIIPTAWLGRSNQLRFIGLGSSQILRWRKIHPLNVDPADRRNIAITRHACAGSGEPDGKQQNHQHPPEQPGTHPFKQATQSHLPHYRFPLPLTSGRQIHVQGQALDTHDHLIKPVKRYQHCNKGSPPDKQGGRHSEFFLFAHIPSPNRGGPQRRRNR
ncbi:hypothetical protein Rifp1Sym_ck00050 [endosymbiont of Riftia pachyptila (vent Ph05)]|uniref:Uncharacterized protein n=1 Tax=endosymbiont of Riftia pachyptila (vent Ph05) TaxID=1048808 RepID=G2DF33_9GAMM|nr:hypothetical protein Rifp1Sym_ck00050 [endosymbiont of Riftia pachyptila (vent Ph05)]